MTQARPFFGGVPTDPDVKKLEAQFGMPTPGTLISHHDIAACIGVPWRSSRYRTVVDRWRRKLMRESNVDTGAEPGVGIKVLTPPERLVASEKDFKGAVVDIGRAGTRITAIPAEGLTEPERERKTRSEQIIWRTRLHAAAEVKALRPPPPTPALPARPLPE